MLSSCLKALLFAGALAVNAETRPVQTVVIPQLEKSASGHAYYFPELLRLALAKTEESDGPFEIRQYPRVLTPGRLALELYRGKDIDLMWGMTAPHLEQSLLRVPTSLLQGLNSHRLLLIRAGDQERFAAVDSLEDLKAFRGGMVSHWPDTAILQAQGLPLVTPAHYELLFSMLESGRVDYLPRGLYEVWKEQEAHAHRGLVVEESLMLRYHGPIYFFVNRDNHRLAERVEKGLRLALEDGSFDALFFSIPGFERGQREILRSDRRVLDVPDEMVP